MARPQTAAPRALTLSRLLGFGRRFWPLWLAWVLVWALPPSRDYARRVIWGSPWGGFGQISLSTIWSELFVPWDSRNQAPDNPLPAASAHPRDLDLAVWELAYLARWNNGTPSPQKLDELAARFAEPAALALPVQRSVGLNLWGDNAVYVAPPFGARATSPMVPSALISGKKLLAQARRGQKLEPDNAFWRVAEALAQWRFNNLSATLLALERAAKCPFYDDKTLELARRALAAHERYGAPSLYDKISIANRLLVAEQSGLVEKVWAWGGYALKIRPRNRAQSLRWSVALASIGALMQRPPNGRAQLEAGRLWQQGAWRLTPLGQRQANFNYAGAFAAYALGSGRPDIARLTRAQAQNARAADAMLARMAQGGSPALGAGPFDLSTRAQWLESSAVAGVLAGCAAIYCALWWLAANLFGWRARGAPSTRRARTIAPVVVGAASVAMGLGVTALGFAFDAFGAPPTPPLDVLMISLALLGFFGPPFVLALWCALNTLRRQRAAFALPRRVDMELRLTPATRALLKWFVPAGFAACLTLALAGWALWLWANWQGWGNVDMLAMLPPDRNGRTGSLVWDMKSAPIPLIYGIFLCACCLPVWFWKWRWASSEALRPTTQGGLRWWKESLGGLVVFLCWLFLGVGLALWPLRARANAELSQVLRVGEIARLSSASR